MKKLVFVFATLVAISFASCGGQTNGETATDSTATDTIDTVEVVDSTVADSVITAE
jgi:hypothetical protein